MARLITAKMLREAGAFNTDLFERTFPKGTTVTLQSVRRAARDGMDLGRFASRFLHATAWKAYNEATAPARKAYNEACATARKAYDEACATALVAAWKEAGRG